MRFSWTILLIVVNIIAYVSEFALNLFPLAFTPALALERPWTFVTSMFLHDPGGLSHIMFNMFALFIFGTFLESRISTKFFLAIYFFSGLAGNVAYLLADPFGIIPAIGASGAVYGVIGTMAVMYPKLNLYFFGLLPVPMIVAAAFWILINVAGVIAPFGNIAYQAHLGGILIGALFGFYLRKQERKYVFFFER